MRADADAPAEIADRVVGAAHAGVTLGLEGIAGKRAERRCGIAGAHEDGIGSVAVVVDRKVGTRLVRADAVARWCGKAKTRGGEGVGEGFVGHNGHAVGEAQ